MQKRANNQYSVKSLDKIIDKKYCKIGRGRDSAKNKG